MPMWDFLYEKKKAKIKPQLQEAYVNIEPLPINSNIDEKEVNTIIIIDLISDKE